ncbi:L-amino acid N-acyltransferase YncA [Mobilisporobacter senegalensis]|uniref:L-amino acid N-acyltransferase YncA n=1 Tax=Mobilisporobacter senegalensis TaxID=1329262 RepID=A0A3N1XUG5_9FIRM|nr:GNAT family N-acetyltransferase [Mobilisporobacter senegalensis]ROR28537.1 L-amino acid N-acyltransferase YncA [Mobilisporobacter senegalensis]
MNQVIFMEVSEESQIDEIVSLADRIWREHYSKILDQSQIDYMLEKFQSRNAIREQMDSQGYKYYLLQVEGLYVGFMGIKEEPEYKRLFLSKVYIDKEHRGLGYGSQTFAFLVEICRKKEYNKIWLTVNRQNESSIRAYEKNGFIKAYAQVTDIGHGYVMDDYVMEKKLSLNGTIER